MVNSRGQNIFLLAVTRKLAQEKKYADLLHKIENEQDIAPWMLDEYFKHKLFLKRQNYSSCTTSSTKMIR